MNIKDEAAARRQVIADDFFETMKHHRCRMMGPGASGQAEPGLFFVTVTFNDLPDETRASKATGNTALKNFHDPNNLLRIAHDRQSGFFRHVLNQTVPSNHYRSRKKDRPFAMSFIDLAGSRLRRPRALKMPHCHSIFIVPRKTLPRFEKLAEEGFRIAGDRDKTRHIRTAHCERMPWSVDDIRRIIDYSSKFYRSGHARAFPEDVRSLAFSVHG